MNTEFSPGQLLSDPMFYLGQHLNTLYSQPIFLPFMLRGGFTFIDLFCGCGGFSLRGGRREKAQTLNPKSKVDQRLVTSAATNLWEAIGDLPPLAAGEGLKILNMMTGEAAGNPALN